MKYTRSAFAVISSAYGLFTRYRKTKCGLRILLYHSIGSKLPHDTYGMSISQELFARQVRSFIQNKSEFTPLESPSHKSLRIRTNSNPQIAITFDDGYKDNLYTAAPILLEHGIPFTVFVTVRFIEDNSATYLDKKELSELSMLRGVAIGSHGTTHGELTKLDDDALRAELIESRSRIEDIIGRRVEMLSYPHGKVDKRVTDIAFESGYRLGARSRFGINCVDSDRMVLNRTEIWATDSERVFQQKCTGSWDWYGHYQKLRGI